MKGHLYVMMGLPGCGKSTLAKAIAEATSGVIVCLDDIREELFGNASEQGNPVKVVGISRARMQKSLEEGKTVIYDATNLRRAYRRDILNLMRPYSETITCLVVETPIEECIRRNNSRSRVVPEGVIRRMAEKSSPVGADEGFDKVLYIKDTHIDVNKLLKSRP